VISLSLFPVCVRHLLCPLLTAARSSGAITRSSVGFRPLWASGDHGQPSQGKFDNLPCTAAASTLRALDGYGLRNLALAHPALTPLMWFLSIGPHFCSTLPSDLASRQRPCVLLSFTSIRLEGDFHPQVVEHAWHTLFYRAPFGGFKPNAPYKPIVPSQNLKLSKRWRVGFSNPSYLIGLGLCGVR